MNWNLARAAVYLGALAVSGLAMAGLADFNPATGDVAIHPFNLYTLAGGGGGVASSTLALFALWRGWGSRS